MEDGDIAKRLETFAGWTGKIGSILLATAGFQYLGRFDKVECPACKLKLYNWQGTENPVELHKTRSPDCEFIKCWYSNSEEKTTSDALAEKGDDSLQPPKYPVYSSCKMRLESFSGWPLKRDSQSPSNMAVEGFFYMGSKDRVRCFHCGLTVIDWDDDDRPFDVHMSYSPHCIFAQDRKMAQRESDSSASSSCTVTTQQNHFENLSTDTQSSIVENMGAVCGESGGGSDNCSNHCGVADSRRYSPMIAAVMEYGYNIETIERVIQKFKQTGKEISDASALLLALDSQEIQ